MTYIDFHAHHLPPSNVRALLQDRDTLGVHPWRITDQIASVDFFHLQWQQKREQIVAIGECGLDKVCRVPYEWQLAVFREMIRHSETYGLPLILHCVRSLDEVLALRRESRAIQPWLFHGFRGKPAQLRTLLGRGFHVSFGFRFCEESLLQCPMENLLLESDDDFRPVTVLYAQVARLFCISEEELCNRMEDNYNRLFGKSKDLSGM